MSTSNDPQQSRLAVLIDADNTTPGIAGALLSEIAKYGVASVKRIYGDWTQPNLKGWKDVLVSMAIQPVQQFAYTSGKNATDSALIIDAMDLLYTNRFDGFCLVSSDSDFTRLASRLRESGLSVYGFGERKTPPSLVAACDRFVYLDVLRETRSDAAQTPPAGDAAARQPDAVKAATAKAPAKAVAAVKNAAADNKISAGSNPDLLKLLREALDDAADDDGWAGLGAVGSLVAKRMPDFDPRNYGFKKLSELLPTLGVFEIEKRGADGKQKAIYLRQRPLKTGKGAGA